MIRVDTEELRNRSLGGAATVPQKVADLMFGKAVFTSETHQRPAFDPDFCFHPFGLKSH
jgi:hypothetical protein